MTPKVFSVTPNSVNIG